MKNSRFEYSLYASTYLIWSIALVVNASTVSTLSYDNSNPPHSIQNHWINAIDENIVLTHNFTAERFNERHRSFDWQWPLDNASVNLEQMYTACSFMRIPSIDLSDSKKKNLEEILELYGLDSHLFYSKRSSNIQCSITKSVASKISTLSNVDVVHMHVYPSVLKIDTSLVNYFQSPQTFVKSRKAAIPIEDTTEFIELPYSLSIEWAPYSISSGSSMALFKRLVGAYLQADRNLESIHIPFFDTVLLQSESAHGTEKAVDGSFFPFAWESILYKYRSMETARGSVESKISSTVGEIKSHRNCMQVINRGIVEAVRYFSRSLEIDDVLRLFDGNMHCLVLLVHFASTSVDVLRLSIIPANTLLNYQARGITQGGKIEMESYRDAGLTGKGQICGVADSGLNDLSCFFVDTSNKYSTITTNRSGVLEPLRRKVIQYTSFADSFDDLGGHGTHVCGSIAGSSVSEFSSMNGMAPEAKLAFFDLGMTDRSFLKVPALIDIFQSAYDAGARVHSNSWGNLGGIYGQMSFDLDEFTFGHPDFLVLFAGGNFGSEGTKSIISPANAKNVLTVGAGQVRSVFLDSPLGDSLYSVASFSSVGPTYDGRIKPDIIAPGDFIESAYSGSPDLLYRALDPSQNSLDWTELTSCAVHQMSGTSMATPITSGTALLVRQYFMDSNFWASICNPLYKSCSNGPFAPSGYLLKALFLHSGQAVRRYSDTAHDSEGGYFSSFSLEQPPDPFQGYGEILLKNILPLKGGKGLHPALDLVVFDQQEIGSYSIMDFVVEFKGNLSTVGEQPLKITLTWYDPPSIMGSSSSLLIHDLDLIVQSPSGELFLGNFGRSTQRELENIRTDDVNTNEQVMIRQPSCYLESKSAAVADCKYIIRVQSYALTRKRVQQYALVITTKGLVSGPFSSPLDPVKTSQKQRSQSASPTAALLESSFRLNAVLTGAEVASTTVQVDFCSFLIGALVKVQFDGTPSNLTGTDRSQIDTDEVVPSGDDEPARKESDALIKVQLQPAMPSNLELTILDSGRKGVAIGGVDLSMGIARFITEWPDDWISSKTGLYQGYIGLREAGLHGRGLWKAYLMNSFSSSARGRFNMTVQLKFESQPLTSDADNARLCGDGIDSPVTVPSPRPTISSQSSQINIDLVENLTRSRPSSGGSGNAGAAGSRNDANSATVEKIVLPIRGISLGSHLANKIIYQDRILLSAFNQSGRLCAVQLTLDPYDSNSLPTRGSSGWLLAVIIKAPNGLVAQVGGYEWLGYDDRFYQRRWPDVWVGKESGGRRWLAERDLHSSGLTSLRGGSDEIAAHKHSQHSWETLPLNATSKPSEWTVELALGYPFGVRPSTNYSGTLILSFWPWKSHEEKSHTSSNNGTIVIDRSNSSSPTNGTFGGDSSHNILSIWTSRRGLVLATFLILAMLVYSQWTQCCKRREQDIDDDGSNFTANVKRIFSRAASGGTNSATGSENIIYSQIDMQSDRFFRAAPVSNDEKSNQQDSNSNNSFRRFSGGTNSRNIELVELRSDSKRNSYGSTEV